MKKRFGKIGIEWNHPIGNPKCPSAYRTMLDFYWFSFRMHKWVGDDDTRAYHSHPWNFITFIIKGYYLDVSLDENNNKETTLMYPGSFGFRKRNYRHYVRVIEKPTWTILFTWGGYKQYSFWNVDTLTRKNRSKYHYEDGYQICD